MRAVAEVFSPIDTEPSSIDHSLEEEVSLAAANKEFAKSGGGGGGKEDIDSVHLLCSVYAALGVTDEQVAFSELAYDHISLILSAQPWRRCCVCQLLRWAMD